jgi:hypothetical protein
MWNDVMLGCFGSYEVFFESRTMYGDIFGSVLIKVTETFVVIQLLFIE